MNPQTTLILGVGNTVLSDEGIGVYVLHRLEELQVTGDPLLAPVEFMDGGTLSFELVAPITAATRLIVIDACQLHQPPGTVQTFTGLEMDEKLRRRGNSVHEVGLSDLLDMARLLDELPPQRALIGIQPHSLELGEAPTPSVAAAIPAVCQVVLALLEIWRNLPTVTEESPDAC